MHTEYGGRRPLLTPDGGRRARQTRALRATGDFPMLLWKDIPPQHFETIFGEYPAHKPKPPMECHPVGLAHEPAPGQEKWRLRPDSTLEVLYPEFQEVVEGGWRNKVRCLPLPFRFRFRVSTLYANHCQDVHTEVVEGGWRDKVHHGAF